MLMHFLYNIMTKAEQTCLTFVGNILQISKCLLCAPNFLNEFQDLSFSKSCYPLAHHRVPIYKAIFKLMSY